MKNTFKNAAAANWRLLATCLISIIVLTVVGYGMGYYQSAQILTQRYDASIGEMRQDYEKTIIELEADRSDILSNQPRVMHTKTYAYEYEIVGIYSSLFTNATIEETAYRYRTQEIILQRLTLADASDVHVDVWRFPKTMSDEEMAIFRSSGHGAYFVQKINDLLESIDGTYKNPNELEFAWFFENYYAMKPAITSVALDKRISSTPPRDEAAYIRLSQNLAYPVVSPSSKEVKDAQARITQIADSISYRQDR